MSLPNKGLGLLGMVHNPWVSILSRTATTLLNFFPVYLLQHRGCLPPQNNNNEGDDTFLLAKRLV